MDSDKSLPQFLVCLLWLSLNPRNSPLDSPSEATACELTGGDVRKIEIENIQSTNDCLDYVMNALELGILLSLHLLP